MSSIASSPTLAPATHAHHSLFRPYPTGLSFHQKFYIFFLQGLGAGFIDFGANFGIAYAMYHGQSDVRMWVFSKNTIAGDLGVTPIIQCAASMVISSSLVHTDLHHSAIKPLPFVWPHVQHLPDPHYVFDKIFRRRAARRAAEAERKAIEAGIPGTGEKYDHWCHEKHGFKFYFWMLVRFAFEGTEMNMLFERCGFGEWWLRLLWTAAQGALLGIIFGLPCWLLAIVILGPIYGTGNMGNKWAPQAIKGVYGCIVGWITNPIIASLALGSQSEHHLLVVPEDVEEGQAEQTADDASPAIDTIVEEEVVDGRPVASGAPASPFLRPFRPASGNSPGLTPSSGLSAPSETSLAGSPGRPRAQSLTRPLSRSRTRSGSLSRPPLTADASQLPPPSLQAPIRTPQRPATRPRGLSTSAALSQFSYQLGGTGGRAQRGRSNTTTTLPDIALVQPRKPFADAPSPSPGARAGSSSPVSNLELAPPPKVGTRERTRSDVAGGASHAAWREEIRQSIDVETRPDVPQFRIQRPSMEAGASPPLAEKDVADAK